MIGFFIFSGMIFLIVSTFYKSGKKRQRLLVLGVSLIVLGTILSPDFIQGFKAGVTYWSE